MVGILRSKLLTAVSGDYSLPVADFSPLILDKPIMALPKILEVVIWPVAAVDILSSAPPYTILFILGALAIGSWIRDLWVLQNHSASLNLLDLLVVRTRRDYQPRAISPTPYDY